MKKFNSLTYRKVSNKYFSLSIHFKNYAVGIKPNDNPARRSPPSITYLTLTKKFCLKIK